MGINSWVLHILLHFLVTACGWSMPWCHAVKGTLSDHLGHGEKLCQWAKKVASEHSSLLPLWPPWTKCLPFSLCLPYLVLLLLRLFITPPIHALLFFSRESFLKNNIQTGTVTQAETGRCPVMGVYYPVPRVCESGGLSWGPVSGGVTRGSLWRSVPEQTCSTAWQIRRECASIVSQELLFTRKNALKITPLVLPHSSFQPFVSSFFTV